MKQKRGKRSKRLLRKEFQRSGQQYQIQYCREIKKDARGTDSGMVFYVGKSSPPNLFSTSFEPIILLKKVLFDANLLGGKKKKKQPTTTKNPTKNKN